MNAIRFTALVLGGFLLSCTPTREVVQATATPASNVPVRTATSAPGYLVWTRGERGTFHTVLLDETSKVLGDVDTMLVAADGHISALSRKSSSRVLPTCDPSGNSADMGPSSDEALSIVRLDDDDSKMILKAYFARPAGEHDYEQIADTGTVTQSGDVAGSVGPYLFLEDSIWQYGCGAHGMWGQSSVVVDVRTGAEVKLDVAEKPEAAARAQFVKLAEGNDGLDSLWENGNPGDLQHVAIEPRLVNGQFGLVHIFVAGVPYAFGNSHWSSYAIDTEVPATPPRELKDHLAMAPAVAAYAAKLGPKEAFGGFSEVEDVFAATRAFGRARPIDPRDPR